MLLTVSPFEIDLSAKHMRELWDRFMHGEEIRHSPRAQTLAWLIRKAERERIGYRLDASPGEGYSIQRREIQTYTDIQVYGERNSRHQIIMMPACYKAPENYIETISVNGELFVRCGELDNPDLMYQSNKDSRWVRVK